MAAAYRHAQSRADVADVEAYATGEFLADLIRGEGDTEANDRLGTRVAAITGLAPAGPYRTLDVSAGPGPGPGRLALRRDDRRG